MEKKVKEKAEREKNIYNRRWLAESADREKGRCIEKKRISRVKEEEKE